MWLGRAARHTVVLSAAGWVVCSGALADGVPPLPLRPLDPSLFPAGAFDGRADAPAWTSDPAAHDWVRLAADCTVDPGKAGSKKANGPRQPNPDCPIDIAKVGGAEEHPASDTQSLLYSYDNFASPIYMTGRGELFGQTLSRFDETTEDIFGHGVLNASRRVNQLQFVQTERYGVTDKFSLELVVENDPFINNVISKPVNGPPTTRHGDEWNDPQFNAIYRVFDQNDAPVSLDLKARWSPDIISANQRFSLEEKLGYITGDLTLEFASTTLYGNEGHSGTKIAPAFWMDTVELVAFYGLSDLWSVKGSASYQISPGLNGDGSLHLHGELDYYVLPRKLQLTVEYGHTIKPDSATIRESDENFAGARVSYLLDLAD